MQESHAPQATSPLATWLYYLERLHSQSIELGLDRIRKVAEKMSLLKPAPLVITVGGTNGKGTTCRTLEAILMAAGYRVGVYSSPHLVRYTERVRVQGSELPESEHTRAFSDIEQCREETSLTYFEFGTLSAFYLFKQHQLDVVILEVGLGGRLDATNIIDADISAITSIALDHTDWLGNTRESIGREKAGIFRAGHPAIIGDDDIPESVITYAEQLGARLYCRDESWWYQLSGQRWSWQSEKRCWDNLPVPDVPLSNAATALAIIASLPEKWSVSDEAVISGLEKASLPGRFQTVSLAPRLILDVAHNPHAAAYLAKQLAGLSKTGLIRCVIAMLADKDIEGTVAQLLPQIDEWYCAPLNEPRGAQADIIAKYVPSARVFETVEEAWQSAMDEAESLDTVIVCGSFHTVAHVLSALEGGGKSGK